MQKLIRMLLIIPEKLKRKKLVLKYACIELQQIKIKLKIK